MPSSPKLWLDTDIGNDIDDVLALLVCIQLYGKNNFLGVSTTFYKPDQKARIARLLLNEYYLSSIPVYAGIGIYDPEKDGSELMRARYAPWPLERFPLPWDPISISSKEAEAYKKLYQNFDSIPYQNSRQQDPNLALEAMSKAAQDHREDLIVLSIGFPTNVAQCFDQLRASKINRIVIMGGWFETESGELQRIGYNTAIDLESSRKILQQKDVSVLIVSSEFCKSFVITNPEYRELAAKAGRAGSKYIGRAIMKDMGVWMAGKNQEDAEDSIHIGDPLAAYLSYHPEIISETIPVELQVNSYIEGVHMFHPNARNYINVRRVPTSNILVVKSVQDPEFLRSQIVRMVSNGLDYQRLTEK